MNKSEGKAAGDRNIRAVFDYASDHVCKNCMLCTQCWQRDYVSTLAALNDVTQPMLQRGRAEMSDFPYHFAARCARLPELMRAINSALFALRERESLRRQQEENQSLLARQYAGITDILRQLGAEVTQDETAQPLMERQVPFYMKEKLPNLFHHWICRNLLAYMRFANGDRSRKNFLEFMNRPNRYIARDALSLSPEISFDQLKEHYKDKDWMCDRLTTLETHLRILKGLAPYAAINFIRKGMGYEEYLREYAEYRKIKPEELSEILDRLTESTKGMDSLKEWEDYIEDYTQKLEEQARKQEKEREGVLISTLHGVKGLEYDRVYILNVNEGSMPYKKAVLEAAIEEERRLFYVGMTRARKELTLCYVRQQYEKKREPSRFLKEAGV